jgi:hypothetical protein
MEFLRHMPHNEIVRADAGKFCGASRLVLVAARLDSNVMR